ncbi:hypothetical protein V8F06_009914 [Rhypophila decipiens]
MWFWQIMHCVSYILRRVAVTCADDLLPPSYPRDEKGPYDLKRDSTGWYRHQLTSDRCVLDEVTFFDEVNENEMIVTSLEEIDQWIQVKKAEWLPDAEDDPLAHDEEALREKAKRIVPPEYLDFLDVFSKYESDQLPPHRPGVDQVIELVPGATP